MRPRGHEAVPDLDKRSPCNFQVFRASQMVGSLRLDIQSGCDIGDWEVFSVWSSLTSIGLFVHCLTTLLFVKELTP